MTGQEYLNIKTDTIGIYLFTNKINHKRYVGQSLNIRRRFNKHMLRMRNKWNYPLYNALNKYGLENFDYEIIYTIEDKNCSIEELTNLLNEKEIYYIELYDSFNNGYNLTKGGESISGYKFSEESCEKRKKISKEIQNDGRNKVFVYNVKTKQYSESPTLKCFLESIGSNSKHATGATIIICNEWIVARTKEQLEEKIQKYYSQTERDCGRFKTKTDFSEELKSDLQIMEWKEFCNKYNVTKGTYYNYLRRFKIPSKKDRGQDPRVKVTKEQYFQDQNLTKEDFCKKYNISEYTYKSLLEKYN